MPDQTTLTPRQFWDEKFAPDTYVYGTAPNAWLVTQRHRLTPGSKVLSVADGEGRNGVWLAQQGLDVTVVDASPRALDKSAALAAERGVTVNRHCADLREWQWPTQTFDAAVSIFAHFHRDYRAAMHGRLLEAVKPGGLILIEAYTPFQLLHRTGGPPSLEMLFTAYMLRDDFRAAEMISLEEIETDLDEGSGHKGRSAVVRMVARRLA